MKKIIIYVILLLLLGSSSVFAQATRSATADKSIVASPLNDPKLSPEEQALLLTAGEDNPAKIDEAAMIDPKLPALQAQKERQAAPLPVTIPVSVTDQPAGETGGTITNYRNMTGPNEQPRGEEPKSILNYRDIQGSNDQPQGDTPNK